MSEVEDNLPVRAQETLSVALQLLGVVAEHRGSRGACWRLPDQHARAG